jgi:cytoskeletal protein RodZ
MAQQGKAQAASKTQLIVIGALFAVLLGVVYFLFLKGGGEEPASATAPAPAPVKEEATSEPQEKSEVKAPKKKSKGPVETSEVFGGKDPFKPVIDVNPSGGGGGAAATTETTDDGTTQTGTGTTDSTTTPPTSPTVPTAPTTPPDDDDDDVVKTGYRVKLVNVFTENGTRKATVLTTKRATRTTKQHELVEGKRFRGVFKLTSLDSRCARFLQGNELFGLCEGQGTIRK